MVLDRTNSCDLSLGQLVKSKAGRDKGEIFIVYDIVDKKHVLIVDGSLRKISNPKRKKVMHLQRFDTVINDFSEIKKDTNFNDALIRRLIENETN